MSTPDPKSEYNEAMAEYEKLIENRVKVIVLLEFKGKLLKAKLENFIIPDLVLEMLDDEIKLWQNIL